MIRPAPLLLTLLSLLGAAGAADGPDRRPIPEADLRAPRDDWFGMYSGDRKVGWVNMRYAPEGEGRELRYVFSTELAVKLKSAGSRIDLRVRERKVFSPEPPFRLIRGEEEKRSGGDEESVRYVNGGSEIVARVSDGRAAHRVVRPAVDHTLGDEVFRFVSWIREDPGPGDRLAVTTFEVDELRTDLQTFEIRRVPVTRLFGSATKVYEMLVSTEEDGEIGPARANASGQLLSLAFGGLFEMRREPEETAKEIVYSDDLFVGGTAPVDRPLGAPGRLRAAVLAVEGEETARFESGPGMTVVPGETVLLRLGEAADPVPATAKEEQDALEATVAYPVGDEAVKAMAAAAVGDARTPRRKVARLLAFVSNYVEDALGVESTSVHGVIEKKKGDCTEHALLFNCLARAAGIPCREVGGVMYMGDDTRGFGPHAWNEVVLDGVWVPVDPTWNQLPADAGHVRFGTGDRENAVMAAVLGRIRFVVREATPPGPR